MKMRWKKIISAMAAASILAQGIPYVFAADNELIIDFENENVCELVGATVNEGVSGNGIKLNGKDQYAVINDASVINGISGDFTVSVWFYAESADDWARVYDIGTGTDSYMFLTPSSSFHHGKPRFALKAYGREQTLDSSKDIKVKSWNNVVVTRSGVQTKMYLNGELTGETPYITHDLKSMGATNLNYLGKSMFPSDPCMEGMIDEFKVLPYGLSDKEAINEYYSKASELERLQLVAQNSELKLETSFYDGVGKKIYTYKNGETVKVKSVVSNYRYTEDMTAEFVVKSGDSQIGEIVNAVIPAGKTYVFETTLDGVQENYSVKMTDKNSDYVYDLGTIAVSDVEFPTSSPMDSGSTTDGAHDPSIFKDPVSGKYYAYSSHNLIFESDNLIDWKKYTVKIDSPNADKNSSTTGIPMKCYDFVSSNYADTKVNGTYWAPDVLYVEEDDHPYWMYVSVSCGLGGRNSVIGLVKSDKPLFWADSTADIEDCGVVIASKETSEYATNAIDANIYTDTDGTRYFIWGSFWKGIHAAKLNADGTVNGVDRTTDATILQTSKSVGKQIYSTPKGIVGPEGPWMINDVESGYRYIFVSYGWLGSNYNIRVARSPLTESLLEATFVDYNGNTVNAEYSNSAHTTLNGYKLLGSYQLGDDITYMGIGHNSVINDDGNWYVVSHTRKVEDGLAYLQVRKLLWTEDGVPVVSPMVYAGEKEQVIPEEMLYGVWDLSSVGKTLYTAGTNASMGEAYKGSDLPVKSSEIIIQPDGQLANGLGSWEYDNDHKLTITFAKDGNEQNYEFYKSGDVMELYVMAAFDKDKQEKSLVMLGLNKTDNISQLARKSSAAYGWTEKATFDGFSGETQAVNVKKNISANPILGFGKNGEKVYGGDPAALVDGDTVYLYVGHDIATKDEYVMSEYLAYKSTNMKDWEYCGPVMKASDISWRNVENAAWASQVVKHNGKYYLYFCTWDKNATDSQSFGKQSIGVAVSDSPTGPFKDIGKALVNGTVTTPETSAWNDIDPTVWIETDSEGVEHRYLGWGNGKYYICELNDDMVSVTDINSDGKITQADIKEQSFENLGNHGYTEAPWLYRRSDEKGNFYGPYYTFFASDWREQMSYAVTDDISSGVWQYKNVVMTPTATSNTNHPSVIDFKGKTYFIYHNGSLAGGNGFRRSVCVEEIGFDQNGNIKKFDETAVGINGTASYIKFGDDMLYTSFTNSSVDSDYPIKKSVYTGLPANYGTAGWCIVNAADGSGDEYVSIEAAAKPGLYITADGDNVVLTQNAVGNLSKSMTFKTVSGISGTENTVSFESVSESGKYLTVLNGRLILTNGYIPKCCEFTIEDMKTEVKALNYNKVVISSAKNQSASIVVVAYDENDNIADMKVFNDMLKFGTNEFNISDMKLKTNIKVRVFIWENMTSIGPVAEMYETFMN